MEVLNDKEFQLIAKCQDFIKRFHTNVSDSDGNDIDYDDVCEKVKDTFEQFDLDPVMDKLWSVLNNFDLFGTEHYETAFIYFNFVIDFELDYKDTYEDIQQFALKMHEKYKFEDFLIKVFKWFLDRKERDEDGNPLVDDSSMVRSINLLNIVADKLMGNSPTLCSAVINNTDTLVVYTHTMKWPKNDGNKLDEDPMMTKFMVGVLSVLYIAINCRWEEAQPILAHDDLQFACWKMMDYKMDCRKDNAIKLKSSSIVAALLTEEEKIMIFEKVAKMFLGRFEEFEKMTSKERDEALQDAARNMAHEEQQIAEGTYRPFADMDLSELDKY